MARYDTTRPHILAIFIFDAYYMVTSRRKEKPRSFEKQIGIGFAIKTISINYITNFPTPATTRNTNSVYRANSAL